MRHVLFSGFGIEVFSAPIFAGIAGLAAFLLMRRLRDHMKLSQEDFWNLVLALVIAVPGGAVLLYVLLYGRGPAGNLPVLLTGDIPGGSFWGSLWTAIAAAYWYCRSRGLDFRPVADGLGLSSMLALFIMRIGCFLHGCCYGLPADLPWSVSFSDPRCLAGRFMPGVPRHPTQIYESLGCLAIFSAAYWLFSRKRPAPGTVFALCLGLYSLLRFAADFTRGGDGGMLSIGPLGTSQIIAAASAAASFVWYRRYAER